MYLYSLFQSCSISLKSHAKFAYVSLVCFGNTRLSIISSNVHKTLYVLHIIGIVLKRSTCLYLVYWLKRLIWKETAAESDAKFSMSAGHLYVQYSADLEGTAWKRPFWTTLDCFGGEFWRKRTSKRNFEGTVPIHVHDRRARTCKRAPITVEKRARTCKRAPTTVEKRTVYHKNIFLL